MGADKEEDYVHRVGRVGRAEVMGLAVSLVSTRHKEKVWYYDKRKWPNPNQLSTKLASSGGCCIWYDEPSLFAAVQKRLGTTIESLDQFLERTPGGVAALNATLGQVTIRPTLLPPPACPSPTPSSPFPAPRPRPRPPPPYPQPHSDHELLSSSLLLLALDRPSTHCPEITRPPPCISAVSPPPSRVPARRVCVGRQRTEGSTPPRPST